MPVRGRVEGPGEHGPTHGSSCTAVTVPKPGLAVLAIPQRGEPVRPLPRLPLAPLDHDHRVVGEPAVRRPARPAPPAARAVSSLYGGSAKTRSNGSPGSPPPRPSRPAASARSPPAGPTARMFAVITSAAFRSDSTRTTRAAPATTPPARSPRTRRTGPARRSRRSCRTPTPATRTAPPGPGPPSACVPLPAGTAIRRPPASPPTIRVTSSPGTRSVSDSSALAHERPQRRVLGQLRRPPRRSSWPHGGRRR